MSVRDALSPVTREPSSFRDPAGYLYWSDGEIYRCVRPSYRAQLEHAEKTGFFARCVDSGELLPFEKLTSAPVGDSIAVLKPRQLPFISYPYEWCFDQLKDAALTTLNLHLQALDHGMLLKDASAYNIQFVDGRATLIDHLSFDLLSNFDAWPAYGQFCRHFLAPLSLMSYVDLDLGKLMQVYIDGIPLDLASKLLPRRSRFSPSLYMHLHLHARVIGKHADDRKAVQTKKKLTVAQFSAIAQSLKGLIEKLQPNKQATEWGDYYHDTNYTDSAFQAKHDWIRRIVKSSSPRRLWDVGGNDGSFSRPLRDLANEVICSDIDPVAVASNYRVCKREGITNVTPLVFDCCNPSPSIGWANKERPSLIKRGKADLAMALALIHHLAISNNVPFADIASFFGEMCDGLIIEFVGKADSQVQRLLVNRRDIFDQYHEQGFRDAFERVFTIVERFDIPDSHRALYFMRRTA